MVTSEAFASLAQKVAKELQTPDARICVVPHPIGGTSASHLDGWAEVALDDLLRLLS